MALRGVASQGNASSNASVIVSVGGIGIAAGDIVLLCVQGGGGTANTFTYPSGFAAVPGLANQAEASDGTQGIAYKVAGGSEPSTYTIISSATDFLTAQCRVYSGRNTAAPFTAVQATTTAFPGGSPVTYVLSALTAVAHDDIVFFIGNHFYDGTNSPGYAPPSGYANSSAVFGAAQFSPILTLCDKLDVTAGSSGTAGGVLTVAGGAGSLPYCAFALSIAVGATGSFPPVPQSPHLFTQMNAALVR